MAVVLAVSSLPRPQLYDAVSRCSFHRRKTMPRIAGLKWITTLVKRQSNHGLLAERYRYRSCWFMWWCIPDLSPTREETAVATKTLNWKLWNCWFPKKWNLLQCYPQTSDSLGFQNRFLSFSCDCNFNALERIVVKLYSFEVVFLWVAVGNPFMCKGGVKSWGGVP